VVIEEFPVKPIPPGFQLKQEQANRYVDIMNVMAQNDPGKVPVAGQPDHLF
jgi:hypothetical protein